MLVYSLLDSNCYLLLKKNVEINKKRANLHAFSLNFFFFWKFRYFFLVTAR
jgi:hypothetical protein